MLQSDAGATGSVVTLAEAALALRVSYYRAHHLLLTGRLVGVRRGHRWMVTKVRVSSLAAAEARRRGAE